VDLGRVINGDGCVAANAETGLAMRDAWRLTNEDRAGSARTSYDKMP